MAIVGDGRRLANLLVSPNRVQDHIQIGVDWLQSFGSRRQASLLSGASYPVFHQIDKLYRVEFSAVQLVPRVVHR